MDESQPNNYTDFHPTKLIVLSELSTREKEKYYKLILSNAAKFRVDNEGRFITNIRLLAPGIRKQEIIETKKIKSKEKNNYASIFQERLEKLKKEGFISVEIQGIVDHFDYMVYPRFTSLIAFQHDIIKPKLRPLSWIMKILEDIYDARFIHEKHEIEREEDAPAIDLILAIFPVFVVRRLGTNIGLKSLVDQTCWDLLYSLHIYRRDYLELEIFGRFLQEFYDHDDLLFFLYVRSVIAKVLHYSFKSRWNKHDGPNKTNKSMWMSYREASHVAKIVFGTDNNDMYQQFMGLITPQMLGSRTETTDSRRIDITEYLHLSVVGYHQSQSQHQGQNGPGNSEERYLTPLPGQIVPPEPVPLPPMMAGDNEYSDQMRYHQIGDETPSQYYHHSQQQPVVLPTQVSSSMYDFDEEEKRFQYEYQHDGNQNYTNQTSNNNNNNNLNIFQQVKDLPLLPQDLQYSPILSRSQPQLGQSGQNFGQEIPFEQSIGYDESNEINLFEKLQLDREQEFIDQLCAPLFQVPNDVYQYVELQLKEQFHNLVSMLLNDKEITDLESLDLHLIEIMSLEELQQNMQELRNNILQSLFPSNQDTNTTNNNQDNTNIEQPVDEGEYPMDNYPVGIADSSSPIPISSPSPKFNTQETNPLTPVVPMKTLVDDTQNNVHANNNNTNNIEEEEGQGNNLLKNNPFLKNNAMKKQAQSQQSTMSSANSITNASNATNPSVGTSSTTQSKAKRRDTWIKSQEST